MFKDKVLLVTGGTGTFGSAVVKRFLNTDIREIRIFSRDEKKQEDARRLYKNDKVKFYIGDVRDYTSVLNVCEGVDYAFHAAALKQVPSCEFNPLEAVKTNCLGAENVISACIKSKVKNLVVLSTDKSVYPINTMGMTKAIMEKLMQAKARDAKNSGTIVCGTRYGNVMASRGSVIPFFIDLAKSGGPLTITSPEMTRFMMSIEDAVDLVLFAMKNAEPGDMFVQKAPSARVDTLSEVIKDMFNPECQIKYIGARHGEKFHESLISSEEMVKAEDMGDYYRIPADNRDLNYKVSNSKNVKFFTEGYTSANTNVLNHEELKELLLSLDYVKEELK